MSLDIDLSLRTLIEMQKNFNHNVCKELFENPDHVWKIWHAKEQNILRFLPVLGKLYLNILSTWGDSLITPRILQNNLSDYAEEITNLTTADPGNLRKLSAVLDLPVTKNDFNNIFGEHSERLWTKHWALSTQDITKFTTLLHTAENGKFSHLHQYWSEWLCERAISSFTPLGYKIVPSCD
jgi:hypothetical protein